MISPEWIAGIAGAILPLIFSYIPGLKHLWEKLPGVYKRISMLVMLVIVTGAAYGVACVGWAPILGLEINCDREGALTLINALLLAIMANQSVYEITKG